jgi:multidrug efflux pump subunit AcrB
MAAQDISFPAMRDKQRMLAQMVLEDPAIHSVTAFAGGSGPGGGSFNVGSMFIALKPLGKRPGHVSADDVVNRLRNRLTGIPGAVTFLQVQQDFQIGGRGSAAQYQYTLSDENLDELNIWAPQLLQRMMAMQELRDVSTDQQDQGLSATLVIDRDTAARLGISAAAIDNVLYDAFGQRERHLHQSAEPGGSERVCKRSRDSVHRHRRSCPRGYFAHSRASRRIHNNCHAGLRGRGHDSALHHCSLRVAAYFVAGQPPGSVSRRNPHLQPRPQCGSRRRCGCP